MYIATLPPVSNRATWIEAVELTDQETGDLIDLTDCSIEVQVRTQDDSQTTVLSASTDDGDVTIVDTGVFQFEFSATEMAALAPDSYDIGAIITRDGETAQIVIGTIPVLEGVVR